MKIQTLVHVMRVNEIYEIKIRLDLTTDHLPQIFYWFFRTYFLVNYTEFATNTPNSLCFHSNDHTTFSVFGHSLWCVSPLYNVADRFVYPPRMVDIDVMFNMKEWCVYTFFLHKSKSLRSFLDNKCSFLWLTISFG